ncbi:xyloside xylosyltransferase 1 isoform X1 [Diorhabda carinulata]|uniref:xyloside xylosyltransferase 1 isoform X1 n=1 Tax=Diorhabda carinulata TaxID=1163345 RepID=UPI0025A15B2B|nr:xyloside xylosyltransferase 1 isoform X1 [Diorhabda carinulata]
MWKIRTNTFLNICIVISLFFLFYYAVLTQTTLEQRRHLRRNIKKDVGNVKFLPSIYKKSKEYNIWIIFTKVTNVSTLSYKFRDLIHNLLNVSSVPLKFNIIVDEVSQVIAENQIADVLYGNKTLVYSFYDIEESANKIQDIVKVMTPHFSSKPGTYYSDALFYISLGLYRIAPLSQQYAILLDCDLFFKKDISLLFNEFDNFKSTALFGLAPELTPVYLHVLHMYKAKHNTTFGDYYRVNNISNDVHPRGFQGYNSGVVLINLAAQRKSLEFSKIISNASVQTMTSKYRYDLNWDLVNCLQILCYFRFRGHLGDQDFYTLVGYEYPHLIQTLNCGFNRQLCTWWRDHGYVNIFSNYFKCEHDIVVLHGNCNTRIPK